MEFIISVIEIVDYDVLWLSTKKQRGACGADNFPLGE